MIKNEQYLRKLNNIKIIKQLNEKERHEEAFKLEQEIQSKKTYLQKLQNQYYQRQREIEEEINKKKMEQLELVKRNQQDEEIKRYMLEKMKKKYSEILEYNRYVLLFNDEFNMWKNNRKLNSTTRYELFSIMFDYDHIGHAYSDYLVDKTNYHYINDKELDLHDFAKDSESHSVINLSIYEKLDNLSVEEQSISLPDIYISNFIINDIINPIIENMATQKAILHTKVRVELKPKFPVIPDNKIINTDIPETINQIHTILIERNKKEDILIEIPVSILIEELYYDIIIKQYKIVNTTFVYMLKHKFKILTIYEFLHNVILSKSSDVISNLIEHYIDFKSNFVY
jgi:hypothetical protein